MTSYLLDTNLLLRLADPPHPLHATVANMVRQLRHAGHTLCYTPQNAVEFWNVATRPAARNGLGITPSEADGLLQRLERSLYLLPDTPAIFPLWRQVVIRFGVSGVQVHDARLVAVMQAHGLTHLLTLNGADFARYAPLGIQAVPPTAP